MAEKTLEKTAQPAATSPADAKPTAASPTVDRVVDAKPAGEQPAPSQAAPKPSGGKPAAPPVGGPKPGPKPAQAGSAPKPPAPTANSGRSPATKPAQPAPGSKPAGEQVAKPARPPAPQAQPAKPSSPPAQPAPAKKPSGERPAAAKPPAGQPSTPKPPAPPAPGATKPPAPTAGPRPAGERPAPPPKPAQPGKPPAPPAAAKPAPKPPAPAAGKPAAPPAQAKPAGQRPPAPSAGARAASAEKAPPRPQPGQARPAKPEAAKPRPGAAAPAPRPPQRVEAPVAPPPPQEIEIPATITVRDLAEMMQRSPIEVIKVLMNYGIMAPITQSIDFDTAAIIGEEMGVKVKRKQEEVPVVAPAAEQPGKPAKTLRQRLLEMTPEERLKVRPPVVTVLGHVDHGKTTLLDAIRKTDVASGEAGGITQHIGAYQVEYQGRKITFLDTPGHEAFTAMRARGAQATDIAVLVVAADDGVMPQTKEAIAHARAAGVPIVVALNKIDKPNANPERVKQELADQGLLVEEWGGDVICVPVSAKYGKGIDELLENLLLLAEVEGFKADAEGEAIGTVIESKLDKTRGPSATLLVQKGTLRTGDALVIGGVYGRVRAMFDDRANPVEAAGPSTPVVVIGLSDVPSAGEVFRVVEDERKARELAAEHASKTRETAEAALQRRTISLEDVFAQMQAGKTKELRLIVKVDVDGSMEPVLNSINHLSTEDLRVKILHAATGDVTESDLMLAAASDAIVIGFNVQVSPAAQKSDLAHQVDVRLYNVIYELVEDVEKALKGLLEPVYQEKVLGRAEVRAVFRIPKRGQVAGCYVQEGEIQRSAMARVRRNGTVLGESRIGSLKRFTEDVTEVKAGFECGVGLDNFNDFQVGDIIEVFQKVRV